MEYIVVNEINISLLVKAVNEKILEGFEPVGGICSFQQNVQQAMIKYKSDGCRVISI